MTGPPVIDLCLFDGWSGGKLTRQTLQMLQHEYGETEPEHEVDWSQDGCFYTADLLI
jgi:hypothetical protein